MKALCLSRQEIHTIMGVLQNPDRDLLEWRTIVKIFTMYKTRCHWDGYSNLTSADMLVEDDTVTIFFSHRKNDQFYCGTNCTLAVLGPDNPMCPKLVFNAYFEKMGFTRLALRLKAAYFIIVICKDDLIFLERESVGTRGRGLGTVGSVSKFPSQPTRPGNWIKIGLQLPSVVLLGKR